MAHKFQSELTGRDDITVDELMRFLSSLGETPAPSFGGGPPSMPSARSIIDYANRTDFSHASENELSSVESAVRSVGAHIPEQLYSASAK